MSSLYAVKRIKLNELLGFFESSEEARFRCSRDGRCRCRIRLHCTGRSGSASLSICRRHADQGARRSDGKPLFRRDTRNVSTTEEGAMLVDYGRRMLAMREEAWASVVRPKIKGRITIGIPDDYISLLLPQLLGKFAATHPRVDIRVMGQPSSAIVPMLKDNSFDLACLTKVKGVSGELIRYESIIWTGSMKRRVWEERPLPLAVFAHGSTARDLAVRALQSASIKYRMSYESPSFLGLLIMVDAGLAVAPLALCGIPAHLLQLTPNDGLPELGELEVVLARSARSARAPCDCLAEQILSEWRA